jgi:hypothetical protein
MRYLRDENDPRQVGQTWHNGYWDMAYHVVSVEDRDGTRWITARWADGRTTCHCTAVDSRHDSLLSEG